jgi:putative (di)nucleoside polyphosphate hydrolase
MGWETLEMNFDRPEKPKEYRLGAGMMILNDENHILLCRRIDVPDGAWQMPQGGIDKGEDPRKGALRELKEETGIAEVEVVAESRDWLQYDLPPELLKKTWGGRYAGQRQKWFLMRYKGRDDDINLESHHPEFNRWIWVPPDHVPDLVVPFKREMYRSLLSEFRKFIERPSPSTLNP